MEFKSTNNEGSPITKDNIAVTPDIVTLTSSSRPSINTIDGMLSIGTESTTAGVVVDFDAKEVVNQLDETTISTIQLTVSGGTAPYTWSWAPTGTGTLTATQTSLSNNIINTATEDLGASGAYEIEVKDANGCTKTLIYPYTRCNCYCNGSNCVNIYTLSGTGNTTLETPIYPSGTCLTVRLNTIIGADRMEASFVDTLAVSTLLVDTLYFGTTNANSCTPALPSLPNGSIEAAINSNGGFVTPGMTVTKWDSDELTFQYTLLAEGKLSFAMNDSGTCSSGAGNGNYVVQITCTTCI